MNSRERRQLTRRCPQKVTFRYQPYDDIDADDLDNEVQAWCNKNVGRRNWFRDAGGWSYRGYFFAELKHASLFVLRWS